MTYIGRAEIGISRAVRFRWCPFWLRYLRDDPASLEYYGLAWVGELSWLGMVLSVNWRSK